MRSILVLAIALAGCSKHVTSLDGDMVVSTLSKDEFKSFCSDYDAWARKNRVPLIRRYGCALDALDPDNLKDAVSDFDAQEMCRKARDACNAKDRAEPAPMNCDHVAKEYDDCGRLTIGEIDDCLREDLDDTKEALEHDYCDVVRKGFTRDDHIKFIDSTRHTGPKCQVVKDDCPKR